MADEPDNPNDMYGPAMQRLASETGITHEQARELILFLGLNWSSLVREAKVLSDARLQAGRPAAWNKIAP